MIITLIIVVIVVVVVLVVKTLSEQRGGCGKIQN